MKQKTGSGKASVTLSTETQHSLTSDILPTDGGLRPEHQNPDLIDTSGAVLKTSKEKGSALLQRNLDERKAVWKGLERTLTEAGSNDDLITELEFTEALSGLSKIQLLVLTRLNARTTRTCQLMTRASSSDCTKKASQQDRFSMIGHIVTSSQS